MTRWLLLAVMLSLNSIGCGDSIMAAPAPDAPRPRYVFAADYPTLDSALRVVEPWGGTLDLGGVARTGALLVRSSPHLVNQSRGVRITNCFGGWTGGLRMAPGVSGYFLTLSECLMLSPLVMDRMFNTTIENVWFYGAGITLTGPAYYNTIRNAYAAGPCVTFTAATGPSLGSNHNRIEGGRCQGTVEVGAYVQDIDITGMAFEGCTGSCLRIAGSRVHVGFNRFECASPVGIELLPGSDGWIDEQVWSSCGVRILFAGADPANWRIAPQPPQN